MSDTVKRELAQAIFNLISNAIAAGNDTFCRRQAEIQNLSALQAVVWVRPVDNQPRRGFIVQIKEVM